jgi:hypothetical protein
MASLYALVTNATTDPASLIWPALSKSREAYNAMVLAANAFYLSNSAAAAREAKSHAKIIKRTAPVMADLSGGDEIQSKALLSLEERADLFETGIDELQRELANQTRLLREAVDENADAMSAAIDNLTNGIHALEQSAQRRFDKTLEDVAVRLEPTRARVRRARGADGHPDREEHQRASRRSQGRHACDHVRKLRPAR